MSAVFKSRKWKVKFWEALIKLLTSFYHSILKQILQRKMVCSWPPLIWVTLLPIVQLQQTVEQTQTVQQTIQQTVQQTIQQTMNILGNSSQETPANQEATHAG